MSIKVTQNYRLYTMLMSGEVVKQEDIEKTLEIGKNSVPVYVFELRKQFGADIESIREGRKVVAYKLKNPDKVKVPKYRINNAQYDKEAAQAKVAAKDGSIAVLDEDAELTSYSDKEMDDIKDTLMLGDLE